MATIQRKSINEIQTIILTEAANSPNLPATAVLTEDEQATLPNLTSTSKVSIFRLFIYVVAVCFWVMQELWRVLSDDIYEQTTGSRPFNRDTYYNDIALEYQHGHVLLENQTYDNTGLTVAQINASKIIAKAATVEVVIDNRTVLLSKVAKLVGGELVALETEEIAGYTYYMNKRGPAGVPVLGSSKNADDLKLHYKFYFDSNVLTSTGARQDGTDDAPVITALNTYLKAKNSNDFNGEMSLDKVDIILQKVPGIVRVFRKGAWSKYNTYLYTDTNAQGNVGPFDETRAPESGYFKLDEVNSLFEYEPRAL